MPERDTIRKAKRDLKQHRAPSTAAGEFVHEEMDHIRHGKHGARSTKQAIAIGLSKARRAGVPVKPPKNGSARTRATAKREMAAGRKGAKPSPTRSRATQRALKREPHRAASRKALSSHARTVAKRRGHASMSAAARKAARTRKRNA